MPDARHSKRHDSLGQPAHAGAGPVREPLPEAAAVRQVTVPDPAPPFDDEAGPPLPVHGEVIRPAGACRADAASARPADDGPLVAGRLRPPGRSPAPTDDSRWTSQFAQVLTETLAGTRPAGQIEPWTTAQTRRRIGQLGPLLAVGARPRLRRVIVTSPARDVLEMTIIVGVGGRVRALAVRLERSGQDRRPERDGQPRERASAARPERASAAHRAALAGRWRCTAVEAA